MRFWTLTLENELSKNGKIETKNAIKSVSLMNHIGMAKWCCTYMYMYTCKSTCIHIMFCELLIFIRCSPYIQDVKKAADDKFPGPQWYSYTHTRLNFADEECNSTDETTSYWTHPIELTLFIESLWGLKTTTGTAKCTATILESTTF